MKSEIVVDCRAKWDKQYDYDVAYQIKLPGAEGVVNFEFRVEASCAVGATLAGIERAFDWVKRNDLLSGVSYVTAPHTDKTVCLALKKVFYENMLWKNEQSVPFNITYFMKDNYPNCRLRVLPLKDNSSVGRMLNRRLTEIQSQ